MTTPSSPKSAAPAKPFWLSLITTSVPRGQFFHQGNFNYDSAINLDDYTEIDAVFHAQPPRSDSHRRPSPPLATRGPINLPPITRKYNSTPWPAHCSRRTAVRSDPPHILVVDDEPDSREILALHLRRAGFEVLTAESGGRALDLVAHESFDAVVLDVMMPLQDGMDVLDGIRNTFSPGELPVLMATARNDPRDLIRALEHGANDYITKPLDLAVLLARLRTHLSLKQSMQRIRDLERQLSHRNVQLEKTNLRLAQANQAMSADLHAAAAVQRSLLPSSPPAAANARFAWSFQPTTELGGDIFNVFPLDDDAIALYVLDVSGHGVAAALLSVTLARFLSPAHDRSSLLWRADPAAPREAPAFQSATPAQVASALNRRFPFDFANNQYFTIVYASLSPDARKLSFVNAGHPGPILIPRQGPGRVLEDSDLPIGVDVSTEYAQQTLDLSPGDRVFFYTDGVTGAPSPDGDALGTAGLLRLLESQRNRPLSQTVDSISQIVDQWCGRGRCKDDVTILAFEVS